MYPSSVSEALGAHAEGASLLLTEVVRDVHNRFADGHAASASRYANDFGTQWRDLLAETHEAFSDLGFQTHVLRPAGHKLPIVSNSLIYVWRVPESKDTETFASSPTKLKSFGAAAPDPMLFEPSIDDYQVRPEVADASVFGAQEETALEGVVRAATDVMPLVLVIVTSTPRQLQSIEWGVAVLDESTGKVDVHGRVPIWEPEVAASTTVPGADSFDSGVPAPLAVEPRELKNTDPDA